MTAEECKSVLKTLTEYHSYISEMNGDIILGTDSTVRDDLSDAIRIVSGFVYDLMPERVRILLRFLSEEDVITVKELRNKLYEWIITVDHDLEVLSNCHVVLDKEFEKMMITVERCSDEELKKRLFSVLISLAEKHPDDFSSLISIYSAFAHLWGGFDPEKGKYDHFINGIRAVKEHTEDIRWLYNAVEDYRSRRVVYGLVRFWLTLDFSYKNTLKENNFDDYFDLDILRDIVSPEEVFVDCGAYIGDTAKAYYENFTSCRKMYLYDMLPANLDKAMSELCGHEEIVYKNVGVGSPEQTGMKIHVNNTETSTFSLAEHGNMYDPETKNTVSSKTEVEIVTLDDDIREPITFLKMDIEGSELNALKGATDHIINDRPKLAICTYHHYEHLWEIPRLIRSIDPGYKFFLRYNGSINGVMASEHYVLAVPD